MFFFCERRDLLCSHSNGDISRVKITCLYFSHVKISCFRANAYPVFKWWLYNRLINSILISMDSWHKQLMNRHIQIKGGSRIFFRRGCTRLLLYFNTNKRRRVAVYRSTVNTLSQLQREIGKNPNYPGMLEI